MALSIRMIMVRDLASPIWVDSVHHGLITRLILDLGGYPTTYQPYLDIEQTLYHPGFHSLLATFCWLTNLDVASGMLIFGQVLNALMAFPVYLFTYHLTNNQKAGLFAAFITSFLTPMPAYYTSWGRYTQLTGLLILPVIPSILLPKTPDNESKTRLKQYILAGLLAGGLVLVHYRVAAFLFLFLLAEYLCQIIAAKGITLDRITSKILQPVYLALLTIICTLPWFWQTVINTILPRFVSDYPVEVPYFSDFSWRYLTAAYGKYTLALAGLGIMLGILRRKRFAFSLIIWILLLFFVANLDALSLPGGGFVNNTSVAIMLFIPSSVLGGYFLSQLFKAWRDAIPSRFRPTAIVAFAMLISYVAFTGAKQLLPIINPVTILSRNADITAIHWISEHIPANETLVINPFLWGYGNYAGNDGGYWISPLTANPTIPPPVLYGLGSEEMRIHINTLSQEIINHGANADELWRLLRNNDIHYIYVGSRGGAISATSLAQNSHFTAIYHENSTWIFELLP